MNMNTINIMDDKITKIIKSQARPYKKYSFYEDLIQDCYLAILNSNYDTSKNTKYSTYLYVIIGRVLKRNFKKYNNINIVENQDIYDSIPSNQWEDANFRYNMQKAKKLLNKPQYEVLTWIVQGRTNTDIANQLGISPQAVGDRIKTIKRKLKNKFETIL